VFLQNLGKLNNDISSASLSFKYQELPSPSGVLPFPSELLEYKYQNLGKLGGLLPFPLELVKFKAQRLGSWAGWKNVCISRQYQRLGGWIDRGEFFDETPTSIGKFVEILQNSLAIENSQECFSFAELLLLIKYAPPIILRRAWAFFIDGGSF